MLKKKKRLLTKGKGTRSDYVDVYGAQAIAELVLRPPALNARLSFQDLQGLTFYMLMNRIFEILYASTLHSHLAAVLAALIETNPESGGPREPWHDWHCKIEGPAAYDVLTNFEQRWNKVAKSRDDYQLLNIDRREHLLSSSNRAPISGDPLLFVTKEYVADTWQVQIFRSMDSGSVKGFPTTFEEVTKEPN